MSNLPNRLRLLACATRRRALLRKVLGWLLVSTPGLAVLVLASAVFRLTAP